ncbi:MAG: NUDIX domain-containing protein [Candidatus Korarchaeota archaeon]|nr:NUDIX domain-containing protein [Candidatus Korarchaeota archaeon]NIU81903.1 NUDIX domain-containing protein [Candidatus Thorarchaeota archaeon]NIW12361.1 NUDIX domain-containing protein [Candidatus Thorarchaeota archaeon]NIW51153.1 NUDIX domain-containing protein [Candidatus Korarchaeota archaeon]
MSAGEGSLSIKENKRISFIFVGIAEKEEEFLLVRRAEEVLRSAHNKWELPGGKLKFGETPEETVEREFLEETGYQVEAMKLLPRPFVHTWRYPTVLQHTVLLCYRCKLMKTKPVRQAVDERVNEVRWVSRTELKNIELLPGVRYFICLASNFKDRD